MALIGPFGAGRATATAARTVTASVRCIEPLADGKDPAAVEVILTNRSDLPVTVSYVHGFTTGQDFNPIFRQKDPGAPPVYTVDDGDSFIVHAGWDDSRRSAGDAGGAIVVTSAGVLVPICGEADTELVDPLPALLRTDHEAEVQAATIAAQTIGRLEGWHAYPALYALLHPDAQAEVSFAAVACWYAGEYGLSSGPGFKTVFSTEVTSLTFGDWRWTVNGRTYHAAAAVAYRQSVGSITKPAPVEGVEHLVKAEGQYRWFFGTDRAALAAQETNCDLGG
jgi:hypothetical protein